jgi:FAD/FMN-containing dehydrogenase
LGGGISYFSPRYGWTCDSATGFEVVLASGSIIEANSQNHPQLASALRGGGNNFGIVTRIDFKTFSQGLVWSASSYHPLSTVEDQIREFVDIASADHFDEYASFLITFGYAVAQGLAAVANNLVYTKVDNTTTTPKVYQGLLSLPTLVSSVNVTSTTALVGVTGGLQENGFR